MYADAAAARARHPALWRLVRRFNPPVQLAVIAALEVASQARDPAAAQLISMAPCQTGSAELYRWVEELMLEPGDQPGPLRVNPTHTLHAVDNLALSAVAIELGNHGAGVGLGGSAGQLWEGLDMALAAMAPAGDSDEVLLFAGDQASPRGGPAVGVAALLSRHGAGGIVLEEVVFRRAATAGARGLEAGAEASPEPTPHSALGLVAMLEVLGAAPPGPFVYEVPAAHRDGLDLVEVRGDIR